MKFLKFKFVFIFSLVFFSIVNARIIDVKNFGADFTGIKDASGLFQQAISQLSKEGGGTLYIPSGKYLFKYTVFLPTNITVKGDGVSSQIIANISVAEGRCAFLVGNSYEWNINSIENNRKLNIRQWLINKEFKDPSTASCFILNNESSSLKTSNVNISNIKISFDYTGCKSNWGGYGIQFANAKNCTASNIWTENACQAVGIGSDTPPSTPGCFNVNCDHITVIYPDKIHTYYAIGFISNSVKSSITNSISKESCNANTPDGSLIAFNNCFNCKISNIDGSVGMTQTSEGVLLNNAYGCSVENVTISNAKKGIVTYFSSKDLLLKYSKFRNTIVNITLSNVKNGLVLLSKNTDFNSINFINCNIPLKFNGNATGNTFKKISGMDVNKKYNELKQSIPKSNVFLD